MEATHGERNHQAPIHELQIVYKGPHDQNPAKRRMYDIIAADFTRKGGVPRPGTRIAGRGDGHHRLDDARTQTAQG